MVEVCEPQRGLQWFRVPAEPEIWARCWAASDCPRHFGCAVGQRETLLGLSPLANRLGHMFFKSLLMKPPIRRACTLCSFDSKGMIFVTRVLFPQPVAPSTPIKSPRVILFCMDCFIFKAFLRIDTQHSFHFYYNYTTGSYENRPLKIQAFAF